MLKNLSLLEKHKRKMAFLSAYIMFSFIFWSIIIFEFILTNFQRKNENENLRNKIEAVFNTISNDEIFKKEDNSLHNVLNSILQDTYIVKDNWEIISRMNIKLKDIKFPYKKIYYHEWYKYYYTTFTKTTDLDSISYNILARVEAKNYNREYLNVFLLFTLLSPILFFFLFFVSSRLMSVVYKPIEEMILNLESFASNINHEFKTSISEILSTLELADITWDYKEANVIVTHSTKRLNNILDVLWVLIYFSNSEYRKQRVDLISLLDRDIIEFRTKIKDKDIKILKKYDPRSHIIKIIDKEPLLLCFRNILKNAIRYSHEGWKIEIYITKSYFLIKDYWVWIDKSNINKIFERYFRENYTAWKGFWIWLSLIKRITEIYNWDIDIKSEKDKFTMVKLIFDNEWNKKES